MADDEAAWVESTLAMKAIQADRRGDEHTKREALDALDEVSSMDDYDLSMGGL